MRVMVWRDGEEEGDRVEGDGVIYGAIFLPSLIPRPTTTSVQTEFSLAHLSQVEAKERQGLSVNVRECCTRRKPRASAIDCGMTQMSCTRTKGCEVIQRYFQMCEML